MPVINGVYTKDFPNLGRTPTDADLIPIAEVGNQVTYKTTVGTIFNAKISGTTGRLSKFTGSNTIGNSILNEIGNAVHLTNLGSSFASFGIVNPGTPGDPGVDNDAYIGSTINNDFLIRVNDTEALRIDTALRLKIANIQNAIVNTGQFLVSDGGVVKYRTGAEILSDLGVTPSNYVPTSRTLTINGIAYDLSANRSWTVPIHDAVTLGTANGLSLSGQQLSLALVTSINNGALSSSDYISFSNKQNALTVSSPLTISTGPTPNLAIQVANGSQNGYLSSTDWNTFNNKASVASLANYVDLSTNQTIGGVKTFSSTFVLGAASQLRFETNNSFIIPPANSGAIDLVTSTFDFAITAADSTYKYFKLETSGLTNNTTRTYTLPNASGTLALTSQLPTISGTTNYISKFNGTSSLTNSIIQDNGTNVSIGHTTNPSLYKLDVNGTMMVTGDTTLSGAAGNRTLTIQSNTSGDAVLALTAAGSDGGGITYKRSTSELILSNSGSANAFKIASTGAATFSSSVTAGQGKFYSGSSTIEGIIAAGAGGIGSTYQGQIRFGDAGNVYKIQGGQDYAAMNFLTNDTVRLTIKDSGNVGIGTTSPGTSPNNTLLGFANGSNIQARIAVPQLALSSNIDGDWFNPTYKVSNFATQLYLDSNQGTMALRTAPSGTAGNAITWNTPAIFIANNGNVLIGTTTDNGAKLQVNGAATFSNSVTATAYFESSSVAGKNILTTNPITQLNLDVIKYTRKSDENKDVRYGYSAEQVHAIMPELTDKDVSSVKYLDVHTVLIQQLTNRIKELEARLN